VQIRTINHRESLIGNLGKIFFIFSRCVDKKERSLSIGLGIFLISIFALLPAPILFGTIIGKANIISVCGLFVGF